MSMLTQIKSNRSEQIVYFRFFASMKYPNSFWHTSTTESVEFNLSKTNDFTPIGTTWEELYQNG